MRRLFGRLLPLERLAAALPPRDPRRELAAAEVARADDVLERIGQAAAIADKEPTWFEATIRPLLPAWVRDALDVDRWHERWAVARRAAERRRQGAAAYEVPRAIFSERALRGLGRFLDEEMTTSLAEMLAR